jgi:Mn2+/Fe2+ NRAMP family transporter
LTKKTQVGAQFGFGMLWLVVVSYPLMVAAQLISAQVGRATGQGLAANIRQHFPAWFAAPSVRALQHVRVLVEVADAGRVCLCGHSPFISDVDWL